MKYLLNLIIWLIFGIVLGVINVIIFKLSNIHDVSWWLLIYVIIMNVYILQTVNIKWIRNLLDIK